jgi:hypothetical protein
MTYKEIINRFRQVTAEHRMLKDFGYGELSDLKTQSQLGPEEQGVDYPYLFLLPGQSNRTNSVMNYQFNMIVMDMARGEEGDAYDNYISIQSQCQQYIDDVLGRLYFYYTDQPEIQLTGITYTPFKEKYQDELAGMTATITIQVPTPLDACLSPFEQLDIARVTQLTDVEIGSEPGEDTVFVYREETYDPTNAWDVNRLQTTVAGTYKFLIEQVVTLVEPTAGQTIPLQPEIAQYQDGAVITIAAYDASGWPTTFVSTATEYRFIATYYMTIAEGVASNLAFINVNDQPADETNLIQKAGGRLTISKVA